MRFWYLPVLAVVALVAATSFDAVAQRQGYGCRGSGYSCGELAQLCSMGNQTPYSVRPYCGGGGPRYRRRDDDDDDYGVIGTGCRGSGYSCRELRQLCSMGNQTPYSVRPFCR